MTHQNFESVYSRLNTKQKQAVDTIYGPVMVIAGPGSGKTELLSARVANILRETDVNPGNILCLTFTDNAAKNMRERLSRIIGADAYKVAIHTFHSFGNDVLNRYRHRVSDYAEASPIDDIEVSRLFDEILIALPWNDPYKPGQSANEKIRELREAIKNLKDAGITPEEFGEIIAVNKKTMNIVNPLIRAYLDELFSLGQKKEDKTRKLELFQSFTDAANEVLSLLPKYHGVHMSFANMFLQSLSEAWESQENESDAKIITKWRDEWLEKDHQGKYILKDSVRLDKHESLARIYSLYRDRMKERGYIDFSDMILSAIGLIEEYSDVRANLAEQYQFVLIDEYQDTNDAQMRLITDILEVSESPNVFAVGDDDQSIYKFQGANTKNIRLFRDRWPDTELIILDTNYRSNSEIIEVSRRLMDASIHSIGDIFSGATKSFHSHRGTGGKVIRQVFENEAEELVWIADDIAKTVESGILPHEIAVISKKNKTLENLAKVLLSKNIPVVLSRDENIFDSEEVRLVDEILEYLVSLRNDGNPRDEILLSILAHPCFGVHRLTIWEISKSIHHARREERKSWIDTLRTHADTNLRNLANFLIELSILSHHTRLEDLIDFITGANALGIPDEYDEDPTKNLIQIDMFGGGKKEYISPIYAYYFNRDRVEKNNISGTMQKRSNSSENREPEGVVRSQYGEGGSRDLNSKDEFFHSSIYARHLANLRKLVEAVRTFKNGVGFLSILDYGEFIRLVKKYDIKISASHLIGNDRTSVNLITVHKAKGLEYGRVYAMGLTEKQYKLGKFGGSPLPKNLPLAAEKDDDEDILRLVYTVFTRAKNELILSYARKNLAEKSDNPLGCLTNIEEPFSPMENISIDSLTFFLERERKELFSLPYQGDERNFLLDRIEKQFVMNTTALQNFLNVADTGPEVFISNNILRFPQAKSVAASYGSAMHSALEQFFNEYKSSGLFHKQRLFDAFKTSFKKEGFDEDIERDYLNRGQENLEALYGEITGKKYGELHLEYDFRTAGGWVFLDDIQITGKIDRIEILEGNKLIVTDYKTGGGFESFSDTGSAYEKVKKWKYKLQLCFYAVLFELSPRWSGFRNNEYSLVFVEQDRKTGQFMTVTEYIQQGEIERTKSLIRAVSLKIHSLDFPDISAYDKNIAGIRQFEEDLLEGNV
ncbi:MAG: ATP-dependent DNA helicase [Candidatus Gracilibacteria bacterium]|nr:ATP-dependent DNA helicase [Candidatus Gracilibacteria bacterium]